MAARTTSSGASSQPLVTAACPGGWKRYLTSCRVLVTLPRRVLFTTCASTTSATIVWPSACNRAVVETEKTELTTRPIPIRSRSKPPPIVIAHFWRLFELDTIVLHVLVRMSDAGHTQRRTLLRRRHWRLPNPPTVRFGYHPTRPAYRPAT